MTRAEERALEAYPMKDYNKEPNYIHSCDTKTLDEVYREVFMLGYKQAEKDLLSNTVDAEIVRDIHNMLHVKSAPLPMPSEYKFGDKVKIIILKDETDNH